MELSSRPGERTLPPGIRPRDDFGVRLEAVQKLLAQLEAKKHEALDEDETLTESEIALGRLVLPLFRDREDLERRVSVLAERAEALQVAVDHIPVPVLVLDAAGALLILNRAARALVGGPALPELLHREAVRLVTAPVHRERTVEIPLAKGRRRLRLVPGQLSRGSGETGPRLLYALPEGETVPIPEEPLISRFSFTSREAGVTALVAQGLTNKEIAARLAIGAETVRSHLDVAFAKSGAKNRAELVTLAVAAVFGM